MEDDTDQVNESDEQLMQRQFATVCEQLMNVARFALPFVLVLGAFNTRGVNTHPTARQNTSASARSNG